MAIKNITDEVEKLRAQRKSMALFFFDQCTGCYSGEMSYVPYNPKLESFFISLGVSHFNGDYSKRRNEFAALLRQFADDIEISEEEQKKQKIDDDSIPF